MQLLHPLCAGLDVHKKTVSDCILVANAHVKRCGPGPTYATTSSR
jgi:nicotinate-nucleotide pyrophosphorylase